MGIYETFWAAAATAVAALSLAVNIFQYHRSMKQNLQEKLFEQVTQCAGRISAFIRFGIAKKLYNAREIVVSETFKEVMDEIEQLRQMTLRMNARQNTGVEIFVTSLENHINRFLDSLRPVVATTSPELRLEAERMANLVLDQVRGDVDEDCRVLCALFMVN